MKKRTKTVLIIIAAVSLAVMVAGIILMSLYGKESEDAIGIGMLMLIFGFGGLGGLYGFWAAKREKKPPTKNKLRLKILFIVLSGLFFALILFTCIIGLIKGSESLSSTFYPIIFFGSAFFWSVYSYFSDKHSLREKLEKRVLIERNDERNHAVFGKAAFITWIINLFAMGIMFAVAYGAGLNSQVLWTVAGLFAVNSVSMFILTIYFDKKM